MSEYLVEFRSQWRPTVAGFLGTSAGLATISFVMAVMGPYLVSDLGLSRSQLALAGTIAVSSTLTFPIGGRLTDLVGPRRSALFGVVVFPIIFVSYSQMTSFSWYAVNYLLACLLTVTTTTLTYGRIIVKHLDRSRGLALALAAAGPGLTAIFCAPLLSDFVARHGWREGYVLVAAAFAAAGAAAIALLPADGQDRASGTSPNVPRRSFARDFGILCRMRAFWLIVSSIFLISITTVVLPNLGLILGDKGVAHRTTSLMISLYAIGTLGGRILCGLAIDRFPAPLVAAGGMSLACIGLFLLASPISPGVALYISVALMGLSFGSEADLLPYIIARYFGVSVFSTVFGMTSSVMALGATFGAVIMSITLKPAGGYWAYLAIRGVAVGLGSLLLLCLPRKPVVPDF